MSDLSARGSSKKVKSAFEPLGRDVPDAEDIEKMTTLTIGADFGRAAQNQAVESSREPREKATAIGDLNTELDETPVFDSSIPVAEMDDHMLIAGIREGDDAAFQEILNRYRNQITNFVYRMLNDYDRALDLAQETFVRVYMNADRYKRSYNFSTYVYRIASNLAITDLRQRKRRRLIPLPTARDKDGDRIEVEIEDETIVNTADSMINDERRKAVARAIATLPEKYRTAVVLRDIEGRSYEEIAEVLGLSDGTVKSRINRARNLLKEKLTEFL